MKRVLLIIALFSMCCFKIKAEAPTRGPWNVRDFGAKGDGVTDDSDAIQRCLATAADDKVPRYAPHIGTGEVLFPKGTYLVSRTLLVGSKKTGGSMICLRGEEATIRQTDPAKDIFYIPGWRNLVEGLTFEGGKRHLRICTFNNDTGHIVIRNCTFRNSSSYAIDDRMWDGPNPANMKAPYNIGVDTNGLPVLTPAYDEEEYEKTRKHSGNSTIMVITGCVFDHCMRVLYGDTDEVRLDHSRIETHPEMQGAAIVVTAVMRIEDVTGLGHVKPGTDQWWVEKTDYFGGVSFRRVKLDTDSTNGMCVVYNRQRMAGGTPTFIVAEDSEFKSAGCKEGCLIYLHDAPNMINIRNCREISGKPVNILGFNKEFDEEYFHCIREELIAYLLDDNNQGLVPNLPGAMKKFERKPLPKDVARLFDVNPKRITLEEMRKKCKETICVLDFGAKGDGNADDSEAIQKAVDEAAKSNGTAEVVIPTGRYMLSRTIVLPEKIILRGQGYPLFTAKSPEKAVLFSAPDARHLVLQNLNFFQCGTAIEISTKPDVESKILIDNSFFKNIDDAAIKCLSGKGEIAEKNKTLLWSTDCTFVYARALVHNANEAVIENAWITTDPDMKDTGEVVNKGRFWMKGLCGVPQATRKYKTGGVNRESTAANDMRWIDNYYEVTCQGCRFGGEDGGLPAVVNFTRKGHVLIEDGWTCIHGGNPKRYTVVDCEEIPEIIALRGAIFWMGSQKTVTVRKGATGPLEGHFFESANAQPIRIYDERACVSSSASDSAGKLARIDLGEGLSFEMVRIEPGEFTIGSPANQKGRGEDENQHRIKISKPFYMGKVEVTQALWERVMTTDIPDFKTNKHIVEEPIKARPSEKFDPISPVEGVSWRDCKEFIARLNRIVPGGGFRLPTEAEWEYCARAGTITPYFFGDDSSEIVTYAWDKENSGGKVHPVGTKKANPWGLYDMYGNVWEWCEDKYEHESGGAYPFNDEKVIVDYCNRGEEGGDIRNVIRGGSYRFGPGYCNSSNRGEFDPWHRDHEMGLRLARTITVK